MKIVIGCDHAGFDYKQQLVSYLTKKGHEVSDKGCFSESSVDYPDFAHPVAKAVNDGIAEFGILICGSGNGVNITANKYNKVRSALCWIKEIAQLAREHNDANVIALPARYTSFVQVTEMVEVFLTTEFAGGRHQNRVNKIPCN